MTESTSSSNKYGIRSPLSKEQGASLSSGSAQSHASSDASESPNNTDEYKSTPYIPGTIQLPASLQVVNSDEPKKHSNSSGRTDKTDASNEENGSKIEEPETGKKELQEKEGSQAQAKMNSGTSKIPSDLPIPTPVYNAAANQVPRPNSVGSIPSQGALRNAGQAVTGSKPNSQASAQGQLPQNMNIPQSPQVFATPSFGTQNMHSYQTGQSMPRQSQPQPVIPKLDFAGDPQAPSAQNAVGAQPTYTYGPAQNNPQSASAPYPFKANAQPGVPVAIPAQPINPSQSYAAQQAYAQMSQKKGNHAIIIAIICVLVALIALGTTLFFIFDPLHLFNESIDADPPSTTEVEKVYNEDKTIQNQVMDQFQYVNTDNVKGPDLTNITIGDVKQNESGNKDIYCDTSATARFSNNDIDATANLTMRMAYDKNAGEWKAGEISVNSPSAEPLGPPDIKMIEDNIFTILRAYDSAGALTFSGATVSSDAQVDKNGGVAAFTLTKTDEATGETKTCTLNTNIDWNNSNGWNVRIDSAKGLEEADQPQEGPAENNGEGNGTDSTNNPTDSSSSSSGGNNNSSGNSNNPTMLLECWSGDLVQVPGVIEFDGPHILLHTDHVIKVVFNGQTFITTYFELTGNGGWYRGEHTTVVGEISLTGSLAKAPLVINVDYE